VAGSGRRGGVLVEGRSGGVAASLGVVMWLEEEARWWGDCGCSVRGEKKNTAGGGGGIRLATVRFPFKGGRRECSGGGVGKSGDAWGGAGEREGEPGAAENGSGSRHRPQAGRHGRQRCRATVTVGGMRAAQTRVADRWDRATLGPSGQRRGAGQACNCTRC
jgi:hypothetical protein